MLIRHYPFSINLDTKFGAGSAALVRGAPMINMINMINIINLGIRDKGMFMKNSVLFGLALLALCSVPGFGSSPGVIDCHERIAGVAAYERPGSRAVVELLNCNQRVSIIEIDQGYAEIQINDRQTGFVEARHVRMLASKPSRPAKPKPVESAPPAKSPSTKSSPAVSQADSKPSDTRVESKPRDVRPAPSDYDFYNRPEYPRFEIFGGYSYVLLDKGIGSTMDGWNAAFTGNINSVFGVKAEVSGVYVKIENEDDDADYNSRVSSYSFMAGPQVNATAGPARFFGHALFGIERLGFSYEGVSLGASNSFAMALGGGINWGKGTIAVRAPQIDYYPWRNAGGTLNNFRISAGIVFHLGN